MTREQLVKYKFKAYMPIDYRHPRPIEGANDVVSCLLISVDFDNETFRLQVLDDDFYAAELITHISFCELPKKTPPPLKVIK
jgi:hypothetical protein